jgi:SAM-dependent methyltransferase
MNIRASLMEHAFVYRLWQAPFAEQKLAPFFAHNDVGAIRRVLDVGCGPGTNTAHFRSADYLGVDINPKYIESARARHGRTFVVTDVTANPDLGGRFDCVFINSFLHHVNDGDTDNILARLAPRLTPDGHVHALELVLPPRPSPARLLARLDRGHHARPLERWRTLFLAHYDEVVFEPYALGALGVTLWSMVYFKGKPRAR